MLAIQEKHNILLKFLSEYLLKVSGVKAGYGSSHTWMYYGATLATLW